MQLTAVVQGMDFDLIKGNLEIDVSSIAYDSREVVENSIFVAISGFAADGHSFVEKAVQMGANAVIVEKDVAVGDNVAVLRVNNSRRALARMAATFYANPTNDINLIGITGTNGKTSTTYFVKSIFEQAGRPIGLIGTIGTIIDNRLIKNQNTTPESLNLQQTFAQMKDAGTTNCIMEVSSHALSLNRVAYCNFKTAIFTNLTPDHLELHHSMEEYFNAKAELFGLATDFNIVNVDDEYGRKLIKEIEHYDTKLITYGIEKEADIYAADIHLEAEFSRYQAVTPKGSIEIRVNIPGLINVYNSLAAIACAYCNNVELVDIQKGINGLEGIKGRFEVVYKENDFKVIIDFAHTEDGLEKALAALRPFCKGRIILVFGVYAAPGEKGRAKRRAMGKVAANCADVAIVTSDNPKEQDPNLIIEEIVQAMEEEKGEYKVIVDRKEAIKYAIETSGKDDIILMAGKGHETTQLIGKAEIPFNEAEIVMETINAKRTM